MKYPGRTTYNMRLLRHISQIGASTFEFENVQKEQIHGTDTFFVFRLESRARENTSMSVFCDVVLLTLLLLELCEEFSALSELVFFFFDRCFS